MTDPSRLYMLLADHARQRDMSQNQFARSVGISPATLSAIRHGHTPTLDVIRQLATALDLPVNDLAEVAGIIAVEHTDALPVELRPLVRRYLRLPEARRAAVAALFDQLLRLVEET